MSSMVEEIILAKTDREMLNRVILANTGLVRAVAKKLRIPNRYWTEAIGYGYEGLWKAVNHYDKEKGAFSTCAYFWIAHSIMHNLYWKPAPLRRVKEVAFLDDCAVESAAYFDLEEVLEAANLNANYREVIRLRYSGHKIREIAATKKVSKARIQQILVRSYWRLLPVVKGVQND